MKQFTNLYQLSKTLKFKLEPEGNTKTTFEKWVKEMNSTSEDSNLFAKDNNIHDAYLAIKPIMDKLHEQFIEESLTSDEAKQIDFTEYLTIYRDPNNEIPADLEKRLRGEIGQTYNVGERFFSEKIEEAIAKLEEENYKGKKSKKKTKDEKANNTRKKPFDCLTDKKIFNYLSANVEDLAKQNGIDDQQALDKYIKQFKGFWGYLDGYNQNRENYYEVEKEASTAVATRIVHENLPTFCSNALRFEKHKDEYLSIYQFLKDNSRETKIKNSQGNEVEAEAITETCFLIGHFNYCLAQSQIEEYNRIIGNYNYQINLYNQARRDEKGFNKIDEFEKLKKQIGCGKKKTMFAALIKDKHSELTEEQKKKENEEGAILSVETLLKRAKDAGDVMFNKTNDKVEIKSIPDFIQFLEECDNWDGIYMSKTAINKISNLYFANWHSIVDTFIEIYNGKDKELKEKVKSCITYDKKREEPLKLRDAVELSGLFTVLDKVQSEHFFKESLFKDDDTNEYRSIINKSLSPSKNLIKLLCFDMKHYTEAFVKESSKIVTKKRYKDENRQTGKEDETIKEIKEWFDGATDAMRIVRYFAVRRGKMKGNLPNVTLEQALSNLLYSEDVQWFKWYDLIRNYLTKKPQDDVKENMLKLNFGNSSLLGGWSDGQEKTKAAVLLKYENDLYLCILKTRDVFDTSKEDNPIYTIQFNASRLIIRNLKFQTLAGKGFLSENQVSYGEMGKDNPTKAILCLQKIIKERYVKKYPLLEKFVTNEYTDKSEFDAEISDTLKECYVCEFVPINWNSVVEKQKDEELFLFKILCKDYKPNSIGKRDLQTIYWEDVLSDASNHQLCAGAEIFMRKPVAKESPLIHRMGSKLVNKRDKDGNTIPDKLYREIYSYANGKTKIISKEAKKYIDEDKVTIKDVRHEIIKDKRFYGEPQEPQYMFHCPIKLNYKTKGYKEPKYAFPEVNTKINDRLQQSDNLQFIGIDRGEKHLVYSCIIDGDCKIVDCHHHDNINGTDYVQKLEAVSDERIIAKKNWQAQSKIKDLKSGYISHVVHNLVEEVIKDDDKRIAPHAYIVLEDLNTEMKRGRQKIEKQVYQNLEVALAKKLNFIVDKTAEQGKLGSVSKALQLTPPISNYQDIEGKKQFGVMLYTRANYTSVTDPATGWRKTIYIKNGKEEDIKKQFMEKFSDFGFDGEDYYFEFTEANVGYTWRMYSGKNGESLPRFRNKKEKLQDNNIWVPEPINVVDILDKLFADFDKTKSFKEQIKDGSSELKKIDGRNETAWQSLRYVLDLIQQIRNSGTEKKDDNFLYSPVRGKNGEHFDTRNHENNGELSAIIDADANGAYNIARKGLIMDAHYKYWVEQGKPEIKKGESALSLYVSDAEWDMYLLAREKWLEHLSVYSLRTK